MFPNMRKLDHREKRNIAGRQRFIRLPPFLRRSAGGNCAVSQIRFPDGAASAAIHVLSFPKSRGRSGSGPAKPARQGGSGLGAGTPQERSRQRRAVPERAPPGPYLPQFTQLLKNRSCAKQTFMPTCKTNFHANPSCFSGGKRVESYPPRRDGAYFSEKEGPPWACCVSLPATSPRA